MLKNNESNKNYFAKLGVNTPEQLLVFLEKNLNYGFTYHNKIFTMQNCDLNDMMNKFYKIRLGNNLIKSSFGVCWDTAEFERLFFEENKIEHHVYFMNTLFNLADGGPTHTCLIYKKNNEWIWFEYSWWSEKGIHKGFKTIQDALKEIKKKFLISHNNRNGKVHLYEYPKVTKRLNAYEFVQKHCLLKGKKIK